MYDGADAITLQAPKGVFDVYLRTGTEYHNDPDGTIKARPWELDLLLSRGYTYPEPPTPQPLNVPIFLQAPQEFTPAFEPDPVPVPES